MPPDSDFFSHSPKLYSISTNIFNSLRVFNLTSFQNPKHSFFTLSFINSHKSQTGFKALVLAGVMRSEEAIDDDAFYMRRCVELAKRATGCTSHNPMVGCVIVKEGEIVGEGFHPKAGQPHAEFLMLWNWAEGECKGKAGWFPMAYIEKRQRLPTSNFSAEVY